jgi:GDP-L-fucose synthase
MTKHQGERAYVAGHRGMVGSAIVHELQRLGYQHIITRSHVELDLTNQAAVEAFFEKERPTQVYLAAAKVGGIHANNSYPAEFIYNNLMMQCNVIHQAYCFGVRKLLFLGSSCIYPRMANQPMSEAALLTGTLEPTNEPYAIAKIAGIKMCESYNRQYGHSHGIDYRSVMPTNLYGPGDNYHPENSHVIPGLIQRFHEAKSLGAKEVYVWGSGSPKREFLYVDDLAKAAVFVMNLPKDQYQAVTEDMRSHLNIGSGQDISIAELVEVIKKIVDYDGEIRFDTTKPDGPPRKLLDIQQITKLGWSPSISLEEGLKKTYQAYIASKSGPR